MKINWKKSHLHTFCRSQKIFFFPVDSGLLVECIYASYNEIRNLGETMSWNRCSVSSLREAVDVDIHTIGVENTTQRSGRLLWKRNIVEKYRLPINATIHSFISCFSIIHIITIYFIPLLVFFHAPDVCTRSFVGDFGWAAVSLKLQVKLETCLPYIEKSLFCTYTFFCLLSSSWTWRKCKRVKIYGEIYESTCIIGGSHQSSAVCMCRSEFETHPEQLRTLVEVKWFLVHQHWTIFSC